MALTNEKLLELFSSFLGGMVENADGILHYDKALALTDEEKSRVCKTIAAGRSNPNILHNWHFKNPINQRGIASGATINYGWSYCLDRWIGAGGNLTWTENIGITLAYGTYLDQITEINYADILGQTICFGISLSDGTLYEIPMTIPEAIPAPNPYSTVVAYSSDGKIVCVVEFINYGSVVLNGATFSHAVMFSIRNISGADMTVEAIKVEMGSNSTLAYDPPMDFSEQLVICKRYYQKSFPYGTAPFNRESTDNKAYGMNIKTRNEGLYSFMPFATEMRIAPTITKYGSADGYWYYHNGTEMVAGTPVGAYLQNTKGFFVQQEVYAGETIVAGDWIASADL